MSFSEYFVEKWENFAEWLAIEYDIELSVAATYLFIVEPSSSKWAKRWNLFLMFFVLLNVIMILLQTCDGPNHYQGREDVAVYPFLLTDDV